MVGDIEYPHRQACLPRHGKSQPDTGQSLQSCIFIVLVSGWRYSPATRTPPNPGLPHRCRDVPMVLSPIACCQLKICTFVFPSFLYLSHRISSDRAHLQRAHAWSCFSLFTAHGTYYNMHVSDIISPISVSKSITFNSLFTI